MKTRKVKKNLPINSIVERIKNCFMGTIVKVQPVKPYQRLWNCQKFRRKLCHLSRI